MSDTFKVFVIDDAGLLQLGQQYGLDSVVQTRIARRTITVSLMINNMPLHDLEKVGIPDYILLNPGRLTKEEFDVMKRHTILGRDAIRAAAIRVNTGVPFRRAASEIAYSHRERRDVTGYPEGLHGDDIPLSACIMAFARFNGPTISETPWLEF